MMQTFSAKLGFIGLLVFSVLLNACGDAASQFGSKKPKPEPEPIIEPTGHLINEANFPDTVFRNCLLATGFTYAEDIYGTQNCISDETNVASIEGAQYLSKVTGLGLGGNTISDLTPLSNLIQLKTLDLNYNLIDDTSNTAVLGNLINLEELYLFAEFGYELSDVSWLANLDRTKFRVLELPRHNLGNPATLDANMNAFASLGGVGSVLSVLNLYNNKFTATSDISALGSLSNLSELYISNNQFSNFNWLQNLSELTILGISSTQATNTDLTYINGLSKLTTLYAGGNVDISNLNQLIDTVSAPSLINLTTLELDSCSLADISPLANLTNLQVLNLDSNNTIEDVAPLSTLANLQELYIQFNQVGMSSILPLQNLTKLTTLDIEDNAITNVAEMASVLSSLGDDSAHPVVLDELYIGYNALSDPDGSLTSLAAPLEMLNSSLTALSLDSSNVINVGGLTNMTHLTELYLSNNAITDVAPLSTLVNLQWLYLQNNNTSLNNINLLNTLTQVTRLRLRGNPDMSCAQVASLITSLGSPPVDVDGIRDNSDTAIPGETCTAP